MNWRARLYGNWVAESKSRAPNHINPAFKTKQVRLAAPDTWRCVECHGWNYKGNHGVIGIQGRHKTDPAAIAALLKDANHGYDELLDEHDRLDLANFVSYGQMDMDTVIDPKTGLSRGDAAKGQPHYRTLCAGCHGIEGQFVAKRHLGKVSRGDPWHSLHNMLNGHPDDTMPALRELDPKVTQDILAHIQTLQERR